MWKQPLCPRFHYAVQLVKNTPINTWKMAEPIGGFWSSPPPWERWPPQPLYLSSSVLCQPVPSLLLMIDLFWLANKNDYNNCRPGSSLKALTINWGGNHLAVLHSRSIASYQDSFCPMHSEGWQRMSCNSCVYRFAVIPAPCVLEWLSNQLSMRLNQDCNCKPMQFLLTYKLQVYGMLLYSMSTTYILRSTKVCIFVPPICGEEWNVVLSIENRFTTVSQCLETHSFVHICLQKTEFVGFRDKKKECKYENKILVP